MVGKARAVTLVGLRAVPVTVEAHAGPGLPGFSIIGSSGTPAREAAHRVRTALGALGVSFPARKILVSLAPADVPKMGARFDLAMAVAVLRELGVVEGPDLGATRFFGELALDGSVRPVPGILPSCAAMAPGTRVVVADGNAEEAALADGVAVVPVATLAELVGVLTGAAPARPVPAATAPPPGPLPDLADVHGQHEARRALEIAAAGGHHLLLIGPPGAGKSMLARRLPSLLPPLGEREALEVAAVRSIVGEFGRYTGLDRRPPFEAPHHGVSMAALLGGGSGMARPGRISLAHHGVLFLDELLEWPRSVLESLRGPLEEGVVRIARSQFTVTYPARVQLVAAANPCPCGGAGSCRCDEREVWRYRAKLSGPLADRLDLAPRVQPLRAGDLVEAPAAEPSAAVAERVRVARRIAADRWGPEALNAVADSRAVRATATTGAVRVLAAAVEAGELSGRGFDRALRVARTCADLAGEERIAEDHVHEAAAHRFALRVAGMAVAARRPQ